MTALDVFLYVFSAERAATVGCIVIPIEITALVAIVVAVGMLAVFVAVVISDGVDRAIRAWKRWRRSL